MVNMLARDPCEGSSLYAKVVNLWFLRQPPAEAHRNRLTYLEEKLTAAALGAAQLRRSARILTVGCGPALEVQRFLRQPALARHATFTLVDFNDETLRYARHQLEELRDRTGMPTQFQFVRKSVAQLLKESAAGERGSVTAAYDLVYCAGLFDYVADALCQRLSGLLYRWVLPGGLYVATNVDPSNARRLTMDYVMEWGLIYRNGEELANLRPDGVERQQCRVLADATGANVFLEVPKPRA
jgi:extracellular factor (EF) 3-hydroxypalmitic acid methyl ester biosynthesis protein